MPLLHPDFGLIIGSPFRVGDGGREDHVGNLLTVRREGGAYAPKGAWGMAAMVWGS